MSPQASGGGVGGVGGRLADHVAGFARLLRAAGLPIGPGAVVDALRALAVVDVTRRADVYWALHAVFVHGAEERAVFEAAFRWHWRAPSRGGPPPEDFAAGVRAPEPDRRVLPRRVAEAVAGPRGVGREATREERDGAEVVALAWSPLEALRTRDFEEMSAEELARARQAARRLPVAASAVRTRRWRTAPPRERIDLRQTVRSGLRVGGDPVPLRWRARRRRPPPLVALLDVSGSMGVYTRTFLHFLHGVTHARERVHTFVFGTRLTPVTREMRVRDPDEALRRIGKAVTDWEGGTRIGAALARFNRRWARRVLGQGAVVLLLTDGLDREGSEGLAAEARRLRRSSRRLIWLNPLLRWDGFEPRAAGIRALLPHVDEFRPVHHLASLEALAEALATSGRSGPSASPRTRAT